MDPIITFPLLGDWFSVSIPRYFSVFGFNIYYYALCIVLGFGLAALYLIKRCEFFRLTTDNILDLLLMAVPCGIIGARIYYMLFNFSDFFGPGKWGNIVNLRSGGLAIYGGIIASGLAFIIYSRFKKIPVGKLLDAAAFGLFIGQAVGRWGNFINREAYGIETDLPWKMGLTSGGVTTYHHPAFLYESLWNITGLLIMHIFSKKYKASRPGQYFLFYVAWYGFGRFMIEGLRVDSLYIPETSLRVSQWLALFSMLAAIGLLLYSHYKSKDDESLDLDVADTGETADDEEDDDNNEDDDGADVQSELARLDGADMEDITGEDGDDNDGLQPGPGDDGSGENVTEELKTLDGAED